MNKNTIWGTVCECGKECFVLQDKHHPWNLEKYAIEIKCNNCGRLNNVTREKAAAFYNNRIFSLFDKISGDVVDFGCGGGFLTQYAIQQRGVNKLYAVDPVEECREVMKKLSSEIVFVKGSIHEFHDIMNGKKINEFISRDVLMFIDNFDSFMSMINDAISNRFRALAWYMDNNERMRNPLKPQEMKEIMESFDWNVNLTYPNWYAYGYFIDARRIRK